MNKQKQLSPETYIRTRARNLPIDKCFINQNWKETGIASIIVSRKHTNGNFTFGVYLVDLFALGTKDSFYRFNTAPDILEELKERMSKELVEEADYVLVHNIIYGANAYAEENGFKVCKEFILTQFILEEDTEDIELIEIEFGKDGKPLLIQNVGMF
ncbi:MAG: hypothetical protein A2046_06355 [Bacteroidetes bacterium GWA2_30_7]|nr:MAG: hypothetical protein A2046_06355 [Bacteroidetes bacterium GWA2_30_7]